MAAATEAISLLQALQGQVAAVTEQGVGLLRRVRGGKLQTQKGLSVLGLRAQVLLQYLQDLALLLGVKARGGTLGGLQALPRLLESRLVLEKLRPIERRLQYHVERLLRAGGRADNDPLRFRPDPSNMAAQAEEEEEEEAPQGPKAPNLGGGRRYVPPRLVPVQYDAVGQEREERQRARARRRALSCSVLRELREELSEGPREVGGGLGGQSHGQRARLRLEESLLLRLRPPRSRPRGGGALDDVTRFGDSAPLLGSSNQEAPPPKKKKRRKVKARGKGFRRRR
ncbi:neuroguidin isoform X2 [Phaenicophaeus curvirostris]|uniref:neuroguidin isoform X2 n=1 Tax=Phaenicophaeus curvirostris TaxID=33595 RepID=UPI0037F0C0D5